jgi:hypothetical protein
MTPQSPRTKGIVQSLVCEVKKHTEVLDNDVQMRNEKIGVLEATQLATDTKLGTMEAAMARCVAGLNREIQDILEYKDYANITRLFHFACKDERDGQGCHTSAKTNFCRKN